MAETSEATTAKPTKKKECNDLRKGGVQPRTPDYSKDWDCPDINPATESAEDKAKRKKLENMETVNKQPKE